MSWAAVAGGIGMLGGGASAVGAYKRGKEMEDVKPEWSIAPEYKESEAARGQWWDTLQGWGPQNNYGSISPDWADIWSQAQQRINQYYDGTAVKPGAIDAVKSSAASRGVSDSPARDKLIARTKVAQGNQLTDLASNQALAEAKFGESARQNWMNSLQSLSSMKPKTESFVSLPGPNGWDLAGSVLGGAGDMFGGFGGGSSKKKSSGSPATGINGWFA